MVSPDTLTTILILLAGIGLTSSVVFMVKKFRRPSSSSRAEVIWDYSMLASMGLVTWFYDLGAGIVFGAVLIGIEGIVQLFFWNLERLKRRDLARKVQARWEESGSGPG